MAKREESSVKLDLEEGAEENEDEEEEDEEEEVKEEENDDDQDQDQDVVDFNNTAKSKEDGNANLQNTNQDNAKNMVINDNDNVEPTPGEKQLSKNRLDVQKNVPKTIESNTNLDHKRKPSNSNFGDKSKSPVPDKKAESNINNIQEEKNSKSPKREIRASTTEVAKRTKTMAPQATGTDNKTVFTKISEELFSKFVGKDTQNKKTSAYDYLINDLFLNRVCEKSDKDCATKFNNFFARNKDFREKKTTKLATKTEKVTAEINATCTHKPNNKDLEKEDLRAPEVFLSDQIKYFNTRDLNINQAKEAILKETNEKMKKKPEISKNSQKIAKKKLEDKGQTKPVHDRLHSEKLNKAKTHVVKEKDFKKAKKSIIEYKAPEPKKKSKDEISTLVQKLHYDAEERKMNKEKVQKNKLKIKELYYMYDSEDELSSQMTIQMILEKFVNNFEISLLNLFNKKDTLLINFDEFCQLMRAIKFTRYNHALDMDSIDIKLKKKKDKEMGLLKDAWKILSNVHGEKSEEERIDSNQMLVFCAGLLGLYKGEVEMNSITANNSVHHTERKDKINSKEPSLIGKLSDSPTKKNDKPIKITKNILKSVLPELDLSKYSYPQQTIKQIKSIFRYFYDNRVDALMLEKKQAKQAKQETLNKELVFKQTPHFSSSNRLKQSAESFRKKICEKAQIPQEGENPDSPVKKQLKFEEAYEIMRKKKEK